MHTSKIRMTSMWLVCIALLVASAVSASSLTGASASHQTNGSVSLAAWPSDDGYVDFGQTPQWMFEILDWQYCDGPPTSGPCHNCQPIQCETAADCCVHCPGVSALAACRAGLCIFAC